MHADPGSSGVVPLSLLSLTVSLFLSSPQRMPLPFNMAGF
jgi:hypothetical protein